MKKRPKDLWLEEGFKILEDTGPGALTIDNLVIKTGKTKGSFYHHFKNRNEYIKALMIHYETKGTVDIFQEVDKETEEAAQVKKLTELVFQISSRLELVIRAWALYDPVVKAFQDRIDLRRLELLKNIYLASSEDASQAQIKALRNYSIYTGLQQVKHLYSGQNFKKLIRDIFVTGSTE